MQLHSIERIIDIRGDVVTKIINKIGLKYGKLTVLSFDERTNKRTYWLCICDCGQIVRARGDKLETGRRVTCGNCFGTNIREFRGSLIKENPRLYSIWSKMKYRCLNKKSKDYSLYGGKGVTVCQRWMSFEKFVEDMAKEHEKHVLMYGVKNTSLDRIDPTGNYEPSNCRWATWKIQNNNKRPKAKAN